MSMAVFLFVPTIIFMTVVAPIWLLLHYRSKTRSVKGLEQSEKQELESLLMVADKLTDRIDALEKILDVESPDWRYKEHAKSSRTQSDDLDS
ncbi:envelope stress response membrane protein PspB [Marinomonas algicola]|jgi:phage shock protein B|uniref:envelope stress response membrane protein PspB n=1 Tax=Marinomonas algicola TaxID=2773454 RepID=UPI00174AFA11|nr:envelope stress response membrane protein PspB [Marinomonas algicola]